jgi:hypothetical protein
MEKIRIIHVNHNIRTASFYDVQKEDFSVLGYSKEAQEKLKYLFELNGLHEIGNTGIAFGNWIYNFDIKSLSQ